MAGGSGGSAPPQADAMSPPAKTEGTGTKGTGRFADLALRSVFAVIFGAVWFVAVWIGGGWDVALVMAAGAIMAWEWRRIHLSPEFSVVAAFQAIAVAGAVLAMHLYGALVALVVLVVLALIGLAVDIARRRNPWWSFWGALYIGLALVLFVMLAENPAQGLETIVWLILLVCATDIGAYFTGRLLGGPKLWRRVSPGKTWSGALGGVCCAVAAAWLVGLTTERPFGYGGEVAVAVSVVAQAGDLAESAYKRRFGKKDAGVILPGHGGLLDRLDGLLAVSLAVGLLSLARPGVPVWAW